METLAARIDRAGPLEQSEAVILAARLARALEGPHERGEAHGAVNPESVLVERDDLSVAVLRASSRSNASFHHQCPERLAGESSSTEDDVWALGSTLYVALTGTVPFPGDSPAEVGARVAQGSIAPLAVFDAGDDDLQELLEGIFHPAHSDRTRTAARVRKSLTRWLAKRGIAPRPALKIGASESAPVDLSTIPPPPRLPEMEDRPTIPRVQSMSGVLYTFADEDTTLPKDTGPLSLSPISGSGRPEAPLSSRLPPTSELLARAKAAQPSSKMPPPATTGQLNPAELANRLRTPSIPPSGPRLNPPKVARDRAAKALSDLPPAGKPTSMRPLPLPPRLPSDDGPTSAPIPESKPASKPSTLPPPLSVESSPSRADAPPSSKRPSPLPQTVSPSSVPPPLPAAATAPAKAKKREQGDKSEKTKKAARATSPVSEEAASSSSESSSSESSRLNGSPSKSSPSKSSPPKSSPLKSSPLKSSPPKRPVGKILIGAVLVAAAVGVYELTEGGGAPTTAEVDAQQSARRPSSSSGTLPLRDPVAFLTSPTEATESSVVSATAAPSSRAAPIPTAASSVAVESSALALVAVGDVGACFVKLFSDDSFAEGAHPKLEAVCRESDPRQGAQKIHEALVIAGMGRTVSDGMREWAVMGWYELAAYAAVRGRCCPDAAPLELPPSPGTCSSMQDALNQVAKASRLGASESDQKEGLNAFRKSLSCMLKSGKSKPFGSYPKPAGGEDTAFLKTVQRTRSP